LARLLTKKLTTIEVAPARARRTIAGTLQDRARIQAFSETGTDPAILSKLDALFADPFGTSLDGMLTSVGMARALPRDSPLTRSGHASEGWKLADFSGLASRYFRNFTHSA
jgi:hypothetical protein